MQILQNLKLIPPVNGLGLVAVEAQRRGQVSGSSPDLVLLPLPRGEGLVDPRRAQESYQRGAKLLPQEGGEMSVRVYLLRQG